jgi:cAMP-dependent protein kinase regulator
VGDYFYVVEEGHVSFAVDNQHANTWVPRDEEVRSGSSLCYTTYNCPRAATCMANTNCRLWKVDQKTFRYMLANNTNAQQKDINDVLRRVPFLAELDDQDLLRISDALTSVTFPEGERIINKGDVGEVFYIVREGQVKVHDIGFGDSTYVDQPERALITGDPRVANVTATSVCTALCLSRDTFEVVLGPLQGLIDASMKKRTLLGVPIFSNSQFQPHELSRLTDSISEHIFPGVPMSICNRPWFDITSYHDNYSFVIHHVHCFYFG